MPGALPLLARLGVDPDGMPLRGVSYRTETRRADHLFRSGEGRGVRRTTLHRALADRATELGITRVAARVASPSCLTSPVCVSLLPKHSLRVFTVPSGLSRPLTLSTCLPSRAALSSILYMSPRTV